MNELTVKTTMTSLELVKEINMFREQEGNRAELRHDTLRDIIKDELGLGIKEEKTPSKNGRPLMLYVLTPQQAKQILVRCKVKPTKEFCLKYGTDVNFNIVLKTRFELSFAKVFIPICKQLGLQVCQQFKVDNYRIDFYIPKLKVAIEYDELHHKQMCNIIKDKQREEYIKRQLGCKFIRVSFEDSDAVNVGKVLSKIVKVK